MLRDRVEAAVAQHGAAVEVDDGRLIDNKLRGVPVYSDLSFQEQHLGRIELDALDARWLLFADGFRTGRMSRAVKRVCDVVIGFVLIVVTLPLMLMTAAAIRLDSPGPVLYRQERTGLHGKTFTSSDAAHSITFSANGTFEKTDGCAPNPGGVTCEYIELTKGTYASSSTGKTVKLTSTLGAVETLSVETHCYEGLHDPNTGAILYPSP